jgi:hypothetical protein
MSEEGKKDDASEKTEMLDKIKERWAEAAERAFCDLLKERVEQEPPDYDWIIKLYKEIRNKLTKILKKDSQLRVEIEDCMDIEIFSQMIRNNVFKFDEFYHLIKYTFKKCKQLGSAGRDKETDEKLKEIIDHMYGGSATFATVMPLYIKNINYCIDKMYEDLGNFSKMINNKK